MIQNRLAGLLPSSSTVTLMDDENGIAKLLKVPLGWPVFPNAYRTIAMRQGT